MDDANFISFDHPISDLVGAFLDAAQAVVSTFDPAQSDVRPAELSYELDQVVSNYLDDHQLSPEHFEAIQQDVVNSIAHQITQDSPVQSNSVPFDEDGNAGLHDVIALLDHHYAYESFHDHADPAGSLSDLPHPGDVL